jgi:hypothetical protein
VVRKRNLTHDNLWRFLALEEDRDEDVNGTCCPNNWKQRERSILCIGSGIQNRQPRTISTDEDDKGIDQTQSGVYSKDDPGVLLVFLLPAAVVVLVGVVAFVLVPVECEETVLPEVEVEEEEHVEAVFRQH